MTKVSDKFWKEYWKSFEEIHGFNQNWFNK